MFGGIFTENIIKKLSWKLASDKQEYIEFVFELNNNVGNSNLILYIGLGVIALVAISSLVILKLKRKNKVIVEHEPVKHNEQNNSAINAENK